MTVPYRSSNSNPEGLDYRKLVIWYNTLGTFSPDDQWHSEDVGLSDSTAQDALVGLSIKETDFLLVWNSLCAVEKIIFPQPKCRHWRSRPWALDLWISICGICIDEVWKLHCLTLSTNQRNWIPIVFPYKSFQIKYIYNERNSSIASSIMPNRMFPRCLFIPDVYIPTGPRHCDGCRCPGAKLALDHQQSPCWLDCNNSLIWIVLRNMNITLMPLIKLKIGASATIASIFSMMNTLVAR